MHASVSMLNSVFTVDPINFQACMGNGSISFCGISMDWNDVLADYEGKIFLCYCAELAMAAEVRKMPILCMPA